MKASAVKLLMKENQKLREICQDLQWMAKRYANGRSTDEKTLVDDESDNTK